MPVAWTGGSSLESLPLKSFHVCSKHTSHITHFSFPMVPRLSLLSMCCESLVQGCVNSMERKLFGSRSRRVGRSAKTPVTPMCTWPTLPLVPFSLHFSISPFLYGPFSPPSHPSPDSPQ